MVHKTVWFGLRGSIKVQNVGIYYGEICMHDREVNVIDISSGGRTLPFGFKKLVLQFFFFA